jgi:hypothetical protein
MTDSFIYVKKEALSPELCKKFIDTYHKSDLKHKRGIKSFTKKYSDKSKITSDFDENGNIISYSSTDIHINIPVFKKKPEWGKLLGEMIPILNENLKVYFEKYFKAFNEERGHFSGIFTNLHLASIFNMQYYKPGKGFYDWHCERSQPQNKSRVLAWMFYLNDVTDGGGTEFYHYKHTENAEQGKLVIFSSDFIHMHRGVISKTQDKYILTGWIEL